MVYGEWDLCRTVLVLFGGGPDRDISSVNFPCAVGMGKGKVEL
jgi:hypothetical protein